MKRLYAQHSDAYTVSELCGLFGKSKQAYYKHDEDTDMRRIALEEFALQYIREIRREDPGIGGLKIWVMYCKAFDRTNAIGEIGFVKSSTAMDINFGGAAALRTRQTPDMEIPCIRISRKP